jgi:hypothetical protein
LPKAARARPVIARSRIQEPATGARRAGSQEHGAPGGHIQERDANYQEAIVQAIRDARAMVLVFFAAANKSDEIKKELSLASRYRVPVLAIRIEDVEPSVAFAYELSTRQWLDAFADWDRSIDLLNGRTAQSSAPGRRRRRPRPDWSSDGGKARPAQGRADQTEPQDHDGPGRRFGNWGRGPQAAAEVESRVAAYGGEIGHGPAVHGQVANSFPSERAAEVARKSR